MATINTRIKLNTSLLKNLDEQKVIALSQTAEALKTEVQQAQVMPRDEGTLQNNSTFVDDSNAKNGKVSLVSSTPYARRLYFHPEYNFSREENIAAGGKWLAPWLEGGTRQNFCQKAFARFYKREAGL